MSNKTDKLFRQGQIQTDAIMESWKVINQDIQHLVASMENMNNQIETMIGIAKELTETLKNEDKK